MQIWRRVNFDSFTHSWAVRFETFDSCREDPLFPWPHMRRLRNDLCEVHVGPDALTNSDEELGRYSSQCDSDVDDDLSRA